MPRPRPIGLHREVTRHGRVSWYYREGHGPRIRLPGEYGSERFNETYEAAKCGERVAGNKPNPKSLAWLVARYRESSAWATTLAASTRKQRDNILKHVIASAGNEPYSSITKKSIASGVDRRRATPDAARHFLLTMRHMFRWAVAADLVESDPTEGVKAKRPRTDGYAVWPEEWCAKYEARWPVGARERVWYEIIYCTGLRRSDAVRVGKQHIKLIQITMSDGTKVWQRRGMIRAQKNDETAYFIVSNRLQIALDAGPVGDLTWIVGEAGRPLTKESFGNAFREACRAAGVPGSAHGIRKTVATIEAEKGASGAKLDALFGWRTGSNTSAIYIRKANRAKLAFGS